MYFTLSIKGYKIRFEARTEKEGRAKARRKIESIRKAEGLEADYYGQPRLRYYGPGEREVWQGEMFYGGEPTYEQAHDVALD